MDSLQSKAKVGLFPISCTISIGLDHLIFQGDALDVISFIHNQPLSPISQSLPSFHRTVLELGGMQVEWKSVDHLCYNTISMPGKIVSIQLFFSVISSFEEHLWCSCGWLD